MKKIFVLLAILLGIFGFYNHVNASANSFIDSNPKEFGSRYQLRNVDTFNLLVGQSDDFDSSPIMYIKEDIINGNITNGMLIFTTEITNGPQYDDRVKMRQVITVLNDVLTGYEAYFGDELFYKLENAGTANPIIMTNNEIFLPDYLPETEEGYFIDHTKDKYEWDTQDQPGTLTEYDISDLCFPVIYGITVTLNTTYGDDEVYFAVDFDNQLTFDQICSKITASDDIDKDITDRLVFTNIDYYSSSGKLRTGNYYMMATVSDLSGNCVMQYFTIKVADVTPPVFEGNPVIDIPNTGNLSEANIIGRYNITDSGGVANVEVTSNSYNQTDIIGDYPVVIKATDNAGNSSLLNVTIRVNDYTKPTIKKTVDVIKIPARETIDINYFKKFLIVEDNYDGVLTEYDILDTSGYLTKQGIPGTYYIRVTASDNAGNERSELIPYQVIDFVPPTISTLEGCVVSVPYGDDLTKEQVLALLEKMMGTTYTNARLTSQYFDASNKEGEYELLVTLEDGTIENHKIKVLSKGYVPKEEEESESIIDDITQATTDNTKYIYMAAAAILLIGIAFIFIRRNRS